MNKNPRLIDMTGQTHGLWTVIKKHGNSKRGAALWTCRCACGTESIVVGADLRFGKSTNCGCRKAEAFASHRRTHGQARTRLYSIWKNMRRRCLDAKNPHYERYGGRGISICSEWSDFSVFSNWALANGYSETLSIDRIDNDSGYGPENCRWADRETQANNRAFVRKMNDGSSAPLLAKKNGIPARTFNVRVSAGWTIEEAATAPYRKRRVPHERDSSGRFS